MEEFRADALLIVHNTVIYHGGHSNMADLARQMFRDCTYDLKEISQCRDCYRFANENPTKFWFCKPCRPFHELVSQNSVYDLDLHLIQSSESFLLYILFSNNQ